MFKHAHAINVWTTIRLRKDDMRTVLVVETDLTLDVEAQAYDAEKATNLTDSIVAYLKDHNAIDEADIVPLAAK